jgi:hypothetical protein
MDPVTIGGALGAIARFAPEVLNFYDRKSRRAHELALADKASQNEHVKGALDAFRTAIQAQGTPSGVGWIDGLNALVRPLITFQWVIVLYPAALILQWVAAFQEHGAGLAGAVAATGKVFGPDERALCGFIVNFWFLNRVLSRAGAA